jgi:hypothetical protein
MFGHTNLKTVNPACVAYNCDTEKLDILNTNRIFTTNVTPTLNNISSAEKEISSIDLVHIKNAFDDSNLNSQRALAKYNIPITNTVNA